MRAAFISLQNSGFSCMFRLPVSEDRMENVMDWIFLAFVGAAVLHVLEEYFSPGGFPDFMKENSPVFAPFVTTSFAILINGLFLVLCILGAIFGTGALVFSLSIGSLLVFNGLTHLAGSLRARRYAPGMISSLLLYLPLGITAYVFFLRSGQLSVPQELLSVLLGIAYQIVPIGYLGLATLTRRN
jgi:hypothetical protein